MKDFGFRLFGRNIMMDLKVDKDYNECDYDYDCISSSDGSKQGENRAQHVKTSKESSITTKEEQNPPKTSKRSQSTITEDTKTAFNGKECSSQDSYNKHVSDETSSTKSCTPRDRKLLKKPENIIPCPRCNSMATKFCYFNNYNVHQPRHFCKDCQRYWTAGGTMRNVPVGAGRRKNKNSPSSQNRSYGFLQENVDNSRVNFHSLPLQVPYMMNHVALQSGFPVPFYVPTQSDHCCTISNGSNSLLSRKHCKDGTMLFFDNETRIENARIVKAKTSKVDDPIEAANSSIWTTLQLKNNRVNDSPIVKSRGGFFGGARQSNGDGVHEKSNDPSDKDLSKVLKLNPAAISRSISFQEIR